MKIESDNLYRERIYKAQLFIQKNIHRDFTLEEVAQSSFFSLYHFHRLFSIYAGEGVYAYTRRLRLQRAAEQLCSRSVTIASVSDEARYDTVSAFTKAFKAHFGHTPSAYRQQTRLARSVSFSAIKDCASYDWKTVEPELRHIEAFEVVCLRHEGSCLQAGYSAWDNLEKNVRLMGLDWRMLRKFGITVDTPDIIDDTKVRYDAGVIIDGFGRDDGFLFKQHFGGGNYAVFTHLGSYETLWHTYLGICLGWLPQCEVELRDTFWFDEYLNRPEEVSPESLRTRIYVPVKE